MEEEEQMTTPLLQDKVVIVTGAGRGIGRGIAMMAAANGAKVVVNDLGGLEDGSGADSSPADEVVEQIKAMGGEAIASYASVTDWDAAHEIVDVAVNYFGRIDCVVNNAGNLRDEIFHKMTEKDFDSVINVHLKDREYGGNSVCNFTGDTNFDLIFSTLAKFKYDNLFTLQMARGKTGKEEDIVKYYRDNFKEKYALYFRSHG